MLYLTIFISLIVLVYQYDYREKEKMSDFWYYLLMVVFIVMAGFRYRVGGDTVMYERYYAGAPTLFQIDTYRMTATRFAPLFMIFQAIPRTFSTDFMWFQLQHALCVNIVYFWFIKKNCDHKFTALTLYFFLFYYLLEFEQIRESLAVAIFLLSWPSYKNNRWWLYYILIFIAIGFHVSSTLLLVLPLFKLPFVNEGFVLGKRTWIIVAVLFAIGVAVQSVFFGYIKMLSISEGINAAADNYNDKSLGGAMLNLGGLLQRLMQGPIYLIFALIFLKRASKDFSEEQLKEYKNLSIMGLMFLYVTTLSLSIEIISRYQNYFCFFTFVLISDWVFSTLQMRNGAKIQLRFSYWALIFVPMFVFQMVLYTRPVNNSGTLRNYMKYYPYENRITMERDKDREDLISYQRKHEL